MCRIALRPYPLIASCAAPGPAIETLALTLSGPEVSAMVLPLRLGANAMVSPPAALASAARSEPGPLSR